MHAVANTENRNARRQNRWVAHRRISVVNGTGTTGQNHSRRFIGADLFHGGGTWQDRAEHLLLPNPPRDQLRVLPAKIQHHNSAKLRLRLGIFFLHFHTSMQTGCDFGHGRLSLLCSSYATTRFSNLFGT